MENQVVLLRDHSSKHGSVFLNLFTMTDNYGNDMVSYYTVNWIRSGGGLMEEKARTPDLGLAMRAYSHTLEWSKFQEDDVTRRAFEVCIENPTFLEDWNGIVHKICEGINSMLMFCDTHDISEIANFDLVFSHSLEEVANDMWSLKKEIPEQDKEKRR